MEFRLLNEKEKEMIYRALDRTGSICTGASYVQSLETYYISLSPSYQITDRLMRTLKGALGTQNIVLN